MIAPERVFHVDELPRLPAVAAPGVLVVASPGCAPSGSDRASTTQQVIHVPGTSPQLLADLRATPAVDALTLTTGDVDADTRLAVSLAAHLRRLRNTPAATDAGPVVTAAEPNETPAVAGLTKILHLATLHGTGRPTDRAVWEWSTPAAAAAWFGGRLPHIGDLHHHRDVLLELRRLARQGRLPATGDSAQLAARLRGRYWSGRWLLENHLLVRRLVNHHLGHPENQP